jgi:aryl-alcohol dehydrogenase-like predicted oxidoreductase
MSSLTTLEDRKSNAQKTIPDAPPAPRAATLTAGRPFGRTGVKVSPLTLGCMMLGGKTALDDSIRIIDRALEAGINILDTANVYSRGRSEEFTGEALKRNGKRDQIFLCSKVHLPMHDTDPNLRGSSRRHIVQQCEASLKRLQTDYLDLYQIHRPEPDTAIDETLRALDDLVRSGKVRYIGSTTFAGWQVVEALWASKELHLNRFVSEQPPYNLLDRRIERELIPVAQTYGLAVIPWSPIGGGILSGKYQRGQPIPADSRYAKPSPIQAKRFTEGVYDIIEPLGELAKEKGVPLSQLALAWTANQPGITSAIIGPRTLEHLEDAIKALAITLTPEDHRRIDAIIPPGTHVAPFYEANHGPGLHRW